MLLAILLGSFASMAWAADSAVILTYNRIDERGPAGLTLKSDTFEQHLRERAQVPALFQRLTLWKSGFEPAAHADCRMMEPDGIMPCPR